MTSNTHSSSTGPGGPNDPRRKYRHTGAEISGFMGAEIFAEGVWLGSAALLGALPDKLMKPVASVVGKVCVKPFLKPIESVVGSLCKSSQCHEQPQLTEDERAERLAKTLLVYTPAILVSLEAKVMARKKLNHWMGIDKDAPSKMLAKDASFMEKVKHRATFSHWTPQEKMIFAVDEGTQLGSFLILHNQMASTTSDLMKGTSNVLNKNFGVRKEKADELAAATWMWVVPNGLGAVAASGMIAGKHLADWPKGWVGKVLGRNDLGGGGPKL